MLKKIQTRYCYEFNKMLNFLKQKDKNIMIRQYFMVNS